MTSAGEIIKGLFDVLKGKPIKSDCTHTVKDFPSARSFLIDTCERGKKKNTVYMFFKADITDARNLLKEYYASYGQKISLTAFLIANFARVIKNYPNMNSYRTGKNKIMCFEDVDVSVMIEKEIQNQLQPIHYILRKAQDKSIIQINEELHAAKSFSYTDLVDPVDRYFFEKIPKFLRNIFWKISRKKPVVMKDFSGTVGLTNMGMFGSGEVGVLPLTPMTTTLAIGAIEERLILVDNQIENHEFINMTLGVDHDLVDGAPMMRFAMELKKALNEGMGIPETPSLPKIETDSKNTSNLGMEIPHKFNVRNVVHTA